MSLTADTDPVLFGARQFLTTRTPTTATWRYPATVVGLATLVAPSTLLMVASNRIDTNDVEISWVVPALLVLVCATTVVMGWLLVQTRLAGGLLGWATVVLCFGASLTIGGAHWDISAGLAITAAVFAGASTLRSVNVPVLSGVLVLVMSAAVVATELLAAPTRSGATVGLDAPHPPLWVLVPLSDTAYSALGVDWLILAWFALLGATTGAYLVGGRTRPGVLLLAGVVIWAAVTSAEGAILATALTTGLLGGVLGPSFRYLGILESR